MRVIFVSIFVCFTALLSAQAPAGSQQVTKIALEVGGSKLRLGMTKAQVAEKLVGQAVTKIHEDEWMLGSLERGHVQIGPTLQFTGGILSYAEREWTTGENDVGEALFGAVSSLNDDGLSECRVTADTKPQPSLSAFRVWLSCGVKTVAVVRVSLGGRQATSVYERLGEWREIKD